MRPSQNAVARREGIGGTGAKGGGGGGGGELVAWSVKLTSLDLQVQDLASLVRHERYHDDFLAFTSRTKGADPEWPDAGSRWPLICTKLRGWAGVSRSSWHQSCFLWV